MVMTTVNATENITDDSGMDSSTMDNNEIDSINVETSDDSYSEKISLINSSIINSYEKSENNFEDYISTFDNENILKADNNQMPTIRLKSNTFSKSVKVSLIDSKGKELTNIKISYNFDSGNDLSTVYSGQTINIPNDLKKDEYHAVTFAYIYENGIIRKSIFFYKDYYSECRVVNIGINRTYFQLPSSETINDYLTVYLRDANKGSNINQNFTYYFDGNKGSKKTFSGGVIDLDFNQDSYHTITLEYEGLKKVYTPTTYTFNFNFKKSIVIDEDHKVIVDGGVKIPCILYDKTGKFMGRTNVFAPFGTNNVSFDNKYTKYTLIKEVHVQKRILESNDLKINYEDVIEYNVRVADGNNKFTSNLNVTFIVDGKTYSNLSDKDGFVTLKIHLKAGNYTITTKYWGVVNRNTIIVCPNYFDNNYKNIFVDSVTTTPGVNKVVKYGWKGNFKGLLKIYNTHSLIKTIYLDNSRYVDDYSYDEYINSISTSSLKEGVYVFKILNKNDAVVTQSKVTIKKIPTQVYVENDEVYINTKGVLFINLINKNTGDGISGNVKVKFNGKTYTCHIKNGKGILTFKSLSKFKKYSCSIIYAGNINYKPSSDKFVITVVKSDSDIYVDSMNNIKPLSKITVKAKVTFGYGAKVKSGVVKFKINGKTFNAKIKKGIAKVTLKSPKKVKTYTCKAIFLGNKNIKSSSTKFKITVKKSVKKTTKVTTKVTTKKITKFEVVLPAELNKVCTKHYGIYSVKTHKFIYYDDYGVKHSHLDIYIYKNGVKLNKFKAKYVVYTTDDKTMSISVTDNYWRVSTSLTNVLNAYKVKATVWP